MRLHIAVTSAKLPTMDFAPTAEQQSIIDAFVTGEDMIIEAGAGTGKTSTLRLLGEATDRSGLYIAYNKAIQTDADKSFPKNVLCKTAHSLAWQGIVKTSPWRRRRLDFKCPRPKSAQQVATLGIPNAGLEISESKHIAAWQIARLAQETVGNFCNSAETEIKGYHVPRVEGVEDHAFLSNYVLPFAIKAWADLNSENGGLHYKHDYYLKQWALTNPTLNAEFILFDEAQDANPVIAKLVQDQDAQKIMVGDRSQAIYGWRGAVDAMSNFEAPHHLILSQSFRFGPEIAAEANAILDLLDAPLRLSGFDQIESTREPIEFPDAVLCRTNAGAIGYAIDFHAQGKKVALVGGTQEIKNFAYGCLDLMSGDPTRKPKHPDLMAFDTWQEFLDYVKDEGSDLKMLVNLILNHGPCAVIEICENATNEKDCDIVISTAHKAKGREWDRVRIGQDFKAPEIGVKPSNAELMLAYVAVTRAKQILDNAGLAWIGRLNEEGVMA